MSPVVHRCSSRAPFRRVQCELEAGHDGAHSAEWFEGGLFWTIPGPHPSRDQLVAAQQAVEPVSAGVSRLATKQVTCAQCGKVDTFGPGWRYPHVHIDRGYLDPRVGKVVCSDECQAKLLGDPAPEQQA